MRKMGVGAKATIALVAVLVVGVLALGIGNAVNLQQERDKAAQCAVAGDC